MAKKEVIEKIECAIKPGIDYVIRNDFSLMTEKGIKKSGEIIRYTDLAITDAYITFINTLYAYGAFAEVFSK
jgi:hypothetical protein